MPKLVFCPFCDKSFLNSTYGILDHINICEKNTEKLDNITKEEIEKANKLNRDKSIKKQLIFSI